MFTDLSTMLSEISARADNVRSTKFECLALRKEEAIAGGAGSAALLALRGPGEHLLFEIVRPDVGRSRFIAK